MTNQLRRAVRVALPAFLISSLAGPAHAATAEERIRAVHEAAAAAAQLCTTPPMVDEHHTLTLGAAAQARLAKFISWLTNLGVSGAVKYETGSSQGVLQKDLAQSIRDSNKCKQEMVNTLTDKMIVEKADAPQPAHLPPPAPLTPASFDKPNGQFVKHGQFWIETPEYAPGQNFTFTELDHDSDYVYLVDRSRAAPGTVDDPMVVRLPVHGGWAQWTYQSPPQWKNFIPVMPSAH
jgi:hypothetical protein